MSQDIQQLIKKLGNLVKSLDTHIQSPREITEPRVIRGIMLTPNHIENIDKLIVCCNDDILTFVYDTKWTLDEFMTKLDAVLTPVPKHSLELFGWIFHGDLKNFQIVSDRAINIEFRQDIAQWQHMIDIVMTIVPHMKQGFKRIDFLACSLMQNPIFQMFKPLLSYTTDMTYASSNNSTGNVPGADWVLEEGGVNLIGTYFNPEIHDLLKDIPIEFTAVGLLTKNLFEVVDIIRNPKTFKGKSGFEIASMVFEIVGYIPGPIGFAAGLVGFGLVTAEYSEKVKNGKATVIDHIDYTMGTLGTLASCVPGGRMATRLSKAKNTRIIKKITGVGSKLNVVVGQVKCMTEVISTAVNGMGFMFRNLPKTTNIHKFTNLYNKLRALETLLTSLTENLLDEGDVELKMSPSRQGFIEILSSIAQDDQCTERVDEFAHIIATQYGTCTVNGQPKYNGTKNPLIDTKGVFVDNEIKEITGVVDTIKINPRTIVYVWPKTMLAPTPRDIYVNDNALDVMTVTIKTPGGEWKVQAQAFDNIGTASIQNGFGVSCWCARNVVINHMGISKIVIKPKTVALISNWKNTYHYVNKGDEDLHIPVSLEEFCFSYVYEYVEGSTVV